MPESEVGNGWNRSLGELKLKNGTIYKLFSAEKPDRLRGPQFHRSWCDEAGSWKYSETWDMLQMGMRLGDNPQNVITTTPKPVKLIRNLVNAKNTYVTSGSTYDNKANLPETFIQTILAKYEGTRLGEQELYAKLLDDVPGALWQRAWIDQARITDISPDEIAKRCVRIVVAIDPATTSGEDSDETGIGAIGIDERGHGYVLADESCRESPRTWARKAIDLLRRFHGDRIIGETNNGGDMVEMTIRSVDDDVPFKKVVASRGKYVRAEPVASLYEQQKIHHVGKFDDLEDQQCLFTPDNIAKNSPDRVDWLVWGASELFSHSMTFGALEYLKSEHAGDMVKAGAATNVEEAMHKIQTSGFIKPVLPDNATECPACASKAVCHIAGQMHCNQCGISFGDPLTHNFMVKQPRNAYINKTLYKA